MGILSALRFGRALDASIAPPTTAPAIASPFAGDAPHVETVVWSDILGGERQNLNRSAAIKVPAVARARHLIAPTIARCPLTLWRGDAELDPAGWMHSTNSDVEPYHRMLWTVDDLIFHGWSLWAVERGAERSILDATRVPFDWWHFDTEGRILVKHSADAEARPARRDEVILIPGPHEGILNFGQVAIRQAAALAETSRKHAENPVALTDLHYTGDKDLTDDEIEALIKWWLKARRGENGSVAFTNKYTEAKSVGQPNPELLNAARNEAAVEVARIISIPATMIDAHVDKSGLTYETSEGRNGEFIDYGLAAYMDSIAARLSAHDVVERGKSTRFDTSVIRAIAPTPTGPTTED